MLKNRLIKMLNKIIFIIISFFAILLTNCMQLDLSKLNSYFTPIPITNKNLDIPKYGNNHQFSGYPYIYWNFCKQKQRQLNIESPETSIDSLIFRMWITNPVGQKSQPHGLVEIIKDTSGWKGKLILMYVDFKYENLSETITNFKIIDLRPLKTNWETIIDSLANFKIAELPTDDSIPGYSSLSERYNNNLTTFSFEYATQKTYRFYQYNNIYKLQTQFWQANNVVSIINLLNNEFKWDSIARKFFSKVH